MNEFHEDQPVPHPPPQPPDRPVTEPTGEIVEKRTGPPPLHPDAPLTARPPQSTESTGPPPGPEGGDPPFDRTAALRAAVQRIVARSLSAQPAPPTDAEAPAADTVPDPSAADASAAVPPSVKPHPEVPDPKAELTAYDPSHFEAPRPETRAALSQTMTDLAPHTTRCDTRAVGTRQFTGGEGSDAVHITCAAVEVTEPASDHSRHDNSLLITLEHQGETHHFDLQNPPDEQQQAKLQEVLDALQQGGGSGAELEWVKQATGALTDPGPYPPGWAIDELVRKPPFRTANYTDHVMKDTAYGNGTTISGTWIDGDPTIAWQPETNLTWLSAQTTDGTLYEYSVRADGAEHLRISRPGEWVPLELNPHEPYHYTAPSGDVRILTDNTPAGRALFRSQQAMAKVALQAQEQGVTTNSEAKLTEFVGVLRRALTAGLAR